MRLNNRDIALKLIAALHAQGVINDPTYFHIIKRYGFEQGDIYIEKRQSA